MASLLNRVGCFIFGHKLKTMRPLLIGGDLVQCLCCGVELCIHHGRQQVIPYDAEVEKFEADLRKLTARYGSN